MKFTLATLTFGAFASAAVLDTRAPCSFTLRGSGTVSGTVGQLGDGQVRIGGGYAQTTFTINNGGITDSAGRGCIIAGSPTQFQCDMGKAPTGGFAIGSGNVLTFNGGSTFYACPAANGIYNIYLNPVPNQSLCAKVTLTASGCGTAASTPQQTITVVAPPASTRTVIAAPQSTVTVVAAAPSQAAAAPAAPASAKTCPANLGGAYQYPHLIVPVDSSKPNTAAGTSYFGQVTSTISTIFNFDVPASYTGTCSLVFLFPTQANLVTSSYTFSGNGQCNFAQLNTVATQGTTFANQGSVKTDYGTKSITPGTSTVVATFACPAGQAVSYRFSSVSGTSFRYFQDYNPSPIGAYITTC